MSSSWRLPIRWAASTCRSTAARISRSCGGRKSTIQRPIVRGPGDGRHRRVKPLERVREDDALACSHTRRRIQRDAPRAVIYAMYLPVRLTENPTSASSGEICPSPSTSRSGSPSAGMTDSRRLPVPGRGRRQIQGAPPPDRCPVTGFDREPVHAIPPRAELVSAYLRTEERILLRNPRSRGLGFDVLEPAIRIRDVTPWYRSKSAPVAVGGGSGIVRVPLTRDRRSSGLGMTETTSRRRATACVAWQLLERDVPQE